MPSRFAANPSLGYWVQHQREAFKAGSVSPERCRRLAEFDFEWGLLDVPRHRRWEAMFQELRAFRERTGHCDVPEGGPSPSRLANWVRTQRRKGRARRLSVDRRRRLRDLGFGLEPYEKRWNEGFRAWRAFQKRGGPERLATPEARDPALARWAHKQRTARRRRALAPERERQLEAAGFEWEPQRSVWEERFAELRAFRRRHGHTRVPNQWPENPPLGRWVIKQRWLRRRGRLSPERERRLREVGFLWSGEGP